MDHEDLLVAPRGDSWGFLGITSSPKNGFREIPMNYEQRQEAIPKYSFDFLVAPGMDSQEVVGIMSRPKNG